MSTKHTKFREEKTPQASSFISKVIGLTGGIASGKSTISHFFQKLGVHIIDADLNAKEAVQKGSSALEEIEAIFGKEMINMDGELNRKRLGELIFQDEGARNQLNTIVHPHLAKIFMEKRKQANEQKIVWVLYDAALIVENELQKNLDGLIVVLCDIEEQEKRLMHRDRLTKKEAQQRIQSQLPIEKKIEVADWIIDNSTTLGNTQKQVQQIFSELNERFAIGVNDV